MIWFKRFFLSLFSAKWARESVRYGFGNILLTGFLSVVFIFLGVFFGRTVPFAAYYNGAGEFREFLYNAFIYQGNGISVTVNGGAIITSGGEDVLINTFTDENDRKEYSLNGYNLIVDSRNVASVYDDFTAYCKNYDGNKEISYDEYLSLGEKEKSDYFFGVRYSGREKQITAEDVVQYTEYFNGLSDGNAKSQYTELTDKKAQMTEEEYKNSLYSLYVNCYYPDMLKTVGESVPTLRNYYYGLTLNSEGGYYCLFGDMQTASFSTYNNNTVLFGGVYRPENGLDVSGLDGDTARQNVDRFIKNSFYGGLSTSFVFELLNSLWLIVATELILAGAMVLCLSVGRLKKSELCNTFGKSAKLVASYAHTAAFFSALTTFCIGFIFSGTAVTVSAYVLYGAILVARTLTLLLTENREKGTNNSDKL